MEIAPLPDAEQEVVELLQDLIRIDSMNFGDGSGSGEIGVADYVSQRLNEMGIDNECFRTTGDRRAGVIVRVDGAHADRSKLLVHAHLDVVPAPGDWEHPPFEGVLADGMVWGRGAVDMKDGVATLLANLRSWKRNGVHPDRDMVFLFLPDEEAGSLHGSTWLVEHRKDMYAGVTEAVGEVGGYSLTLRDDVRLYLVQTAEKGIRWMKLRAEGTEIGRAHV